MWRLRASGAALFLTHYRVRPGDTRLGEVVLTVETSPRLNHKAAKLS